MPPNFHLKQGAKGACPRFGVPQQEINTGMRASDGPFSEVTRCQYFLWTWARWTLPLAAEGSAPDTIPAAIAEILVQIKRRRRHSAIRQARGNRSESCRIGL